MSEFRVEDTDTERARGLFEDFRDDLRSAETVRIELVPGINLTRGGTVQRAYVSARRPGSTRFTKIRTPLVPSTETGDPTTDRAALLADLRRILLDDPDHDLDQ